MTIAFVASNTGSATSGTTIVVTKPTGTVSGHVMLAQVAAYAGVTITPPSGWTLVQGGGTSGGLEYGVYVRVAGGSEPASYTWTFNTSVSNAVAAIATYSGVNNATPVDVSGVATATGTTLTAPSVTTAWPNTVVVSLFGVSGGYAPTIPAGTTSRAAISVAGMVNLRMVDVAQPATGASTAQVATVASGSPSSASVTVALREPNHAPNAPTPNSPATGTTVDLGATNRFGFTPSDPDAGDSQSAFDLQYRLGTGAWTTVSQTTPNSFWDATGGTFTAGSYEWQVRTYDALGLVGPWSASSFFTAASTPGVPSITAPTSGSTISASSATVTWSTSDQTDYQVRKMDDVAGVAGTTVYYDSGDVVDSITRSVSVAFPINNRWEHIQVRVKAAGLWSAWADCRVYVSYTPPMVPSVVAYPDSATASIAVVVTNPVPTGGEPVVSYNDIYVSSPLDPEIRAATLVPPNSMWTWKRPGAVRAYQIRAVAVGTNGTTCDSIDGVPPTPPVDEIIDGGVL